MNEKEKKVMEKTLAQLADVCSTLCRGRNEGCLEGDGGCPIYHLVEKEIPDVLGCKPPCEGRGDRIAKAARES